MSDPILGKLRRKRRSAAKQMHDERTSQRHASKLKRKLAFLDHRIAKVQHRRHGLGGEAVLDGTPMPVGTKLALLDARRNGWTGVATSGDRRAAPPWVVRLIHKLGKSTQAELYYGFIHHLPGFLPANPPTQGSHMDLGDGVVGAVGEKLPRWREGIDASGSTTLREILSKRGYPIERPYASESEEHHSNFTASPHDALIERGLI